jgi:DNA-binding GntR family transcriptional regulator
VRALIPQPTLVDQVYEAVLAEITEGKLGLDSRLIQEELAEALGVSRQPVQQALLLLRSHGLLRDAPGRGLMVAPLDPTHVRNLLAVRGVLDGLASAKVAEIAADTAKRQGPAYLARGRVAVKNRSIAQMTAADMEFHFFLYELSGNPLIGEICTPHWSYLRRVMAEVLRGQTPDDIWDQHEAILKAIGAGDAAKAERIARHHISHASAVLTDRLEQHFNGEKKISSSPQRAKGARARA